MDLNKEVVIEHSRMKKEADMMLNVTVNGKQHQLQVNETDRLVDILREKVYLTGTKVGCGIGRCGACSVFLDGELVNACLLLAYQVNGKSIFTIEGLSEEGLDDIQSSFLREGGFQCGYCTSGMILAVKSLLDAVPNPTEEEIKEGLSGNICRCTGYGGIIRAVQCAAQNGCK